jgi:hypothetical protein
MPDDLRKQIDEALAQGKADRLPGRPPPPRRPLRLPDPRPRSPSQLLLVGLLAALVGWMFSFPFHRELLFLGLLAAAIALLSMLIRPQGRVQHYWRGRPVNLPASGWTDHLYRILYRS